MLQARIEQSPKVWISERPEDEGQTWQIFDATEDAEVLAEWRSIDAVNSFVNGFIKSRIREVHVIPVEP
jgi:hypothetical protein